jgi:CPA1 family monovalent cation:H+ antiporter
VDHIEAVIISLLVAVVVLSALADRFGVPYPILLVLGGLGLGFAPGVPDVRLDPDLVLVVFLPPLLYSGAFFANLRDLRADTRSISLLATGLVVATTAVVAVVAHALVDGLPWAACFALGAIVGPTDPIAATTIARRLGVPRRTINILEGESLLNDASALVIYGIATGATGAAFTVLGAGWDFVKAVAVGVAVGLVVAVVVREVRRRLDDPPVELTLSLLTGYAAYVPAERLDGSGVVAVVTAGIAVGWWAPQIATPAVRMQGAAVWELLSFVLNALLFVLIGLQLPHVVAGLDGRSAGFVVGVSVAVCAAVILTRLAWVHLTTMVIRALDRREAQRARRGSWQARTIVGWAGMRGAVSLAAALALPVDTPDRDLLLLVTFAVILVTLVVQGLTLPVVIRWLRVEDDGREAKEELLGRMRATQAALARIDELSREEWTRSDTIERMSGAYEYRRRRLKARAGKIADDGYEDRSEAYQRLVREVLHAQRRAVWHLRSTGEISNDVMRRLERELDLEDQRLEI